MYTAFMTIPSGYAQATFVFGGPAAPHGAVVTIGIDHNSAGSQVDEASIINLLFDEEIMPQLSVELIHEETLYKYGPDATGITVSIPSGQEGGLDFANQAPNVAILVQKNTGFGGRKNKGRWYLPGVAENVVDNSGRLGSTFLENLTIACSNFVGTLTTEALVPVVLHSDETGPTEIETMVPASIVATQRKRLRR